MDNKRMFGILVFGSDCRVHVIFGSRLGILHCPKARTSVNFSRLLPEYAYGRWGKIRTR
jgi:hypothetical protein